MSRAARVVGLVGSVLLLAAAVRTPRIDVVAFESPSEATLREIAAAPGLAVRWVEPGLVVAERRSAAALPPRWRGEVVAARSADQELAMLRERDRLALHAGASAHGATLQAALQFLSAHRVATLATPAGERWLLVADAGAWPAEVLGCHAGLVIADRDLDPRSLIDDGPPPELAAWAHGPARDWTAAELAAVNSVSAESLKAYVESMLHPFPGSPTIFGDRWSFGGELDSLFSPRVGARMQAHLGGLAGVSTVLQPFELVRVAPAPVPNPAVYDTVVTHNVVAHLPGTEPGTGTFVVGAHIDATGSRNIDWSNARRAGQAFHTPGAEDNASGVACVMEVLRCVADAVRSGGVQFAFDLEFVAFSGEEIWDGQVGDRGLLGSRHYVRQRMSEYEAGDASKRLLGILNLDMVGSDSLGNRLQLGFNPASTWLVDLAEETIAALVPPTGLSLVRELDTSIASDHNSFWAVNVDGLFAADAPVSALRRYSTYHRPSDDGRDVEFAKMAEVTRAMLAILMRFNVSARPLPEIVFPAEKLRLIYEVRGLDVEYNRESAFHPVFPGAPLKAWLSVYNTGAAYDGPLRVEMWSEQRGLQRSLFDDTRTVHVPTGGRLDYALEPVPVATGDAGAFEFGARLSGGAGVATQTVVDTFFVALDSGVAPLQVAALQNPAASLAEAQLELLFAEGRGTLVVEVYNLEGERLGTLQQSVQVSAGEPYRLSGLPSPGGEASGAYLVRTIWRGASGVVSASTTRVVVQR